MIIFPHRALLDPLIYPVNMGLPLIGLLVYTGFRTEANYLE